MALTDAISVACKCLGMASSVYFEKDRTKYDAYVEDEPTSKSTPKQESEPEPKKSALSDKQIKRLYAIAKTAKKTEEEVKKWIKVKWNKDSTKDLNRVEYDEICAALEIKKE
jgi:hypothetical protein